MLTFLPITMKRKYLYDVEKKLYAFDRFFQLPFEKITLVSWKDQYVFTWHNLDFQMYLFYP